VGSRRASRTSTNHYDFGVESWTHSLTDGAGDALEESHVLPVRTR